MDNLIRVLFVCKGNICRSPTAEGIFSQILKENSLSKRFVVDSAGTLNYHAGSAPDPRAQEMAKSQGVDIGELIARELVLRDYEWFDYILAMDKENMEHMQDQCPEKYNSKLHYLLDFSDQQEAREVPDPYYEQETGFARVYDLIKQGAVGLLQAIMQTPKFQK